MSRINDALSSTLGIRVHRSKKIEKLYLEKEMHLKQNAYRLDAKSFCRPDSLDTSVSDLIKKLRPVEWGGDLVRIGPDGDGGYLVDDDFNGVDGCFSPGVATEAGFEMALAEKGIRCHLMDGSVDYAPASHPLITFEKTFVREAEEPHFITLDQWVKCLARCSKTEFSGL